MSEIKSMDAQLSSFKKMLDEENLKNKRLIHAKESVLIHPSELEKLKNDATTNFNMKNMAAAELSDCKVVLRETQAELRTAKKRIAELEDLLYRISTVATKAIKQEDNS